MQWSSALSQADRLETAIAETCATIRANLDSTPNLIMVFVSDHHRDGYDNLPASIRSELGGGTLIGCSGSGVIGPAAEVEQAPALTVMAASLPGVTSTSWHLDAGDVAPGSRHSERLTKLAADGQHFIVLADPFSFPTEQLVRSLDFAFPGAVTIGGLASGGQAPGELAVFHDDTAYFDGAVILNLSGNIEIVPAVCQGCRPIGEPMFLSQVADGQIVKLDERPPVEIINELYSKAGPRDRELMHHSLFVGITMRSGAREYRQGDFLIRNIMGADPRTGAIAVGADLHENQVVQFHLRDAETSADDLVGVLERVGGELGSAPPPAALLFSCTGRGRYLYGVPDHDSNVFRAHFGAVPLSGFFCNGEIGPVQGTTFLHGYTSAFALLRPRMN